MSKGPENTFLASVHRHLPPKLHVWKNNNMFAGGQADTWISGPRADMWIEYKFIEIPKRGETVIDLINPKPRQDSIISTLQQDWLKGRHDEGRTVGVIVGSKDGGVWFPGVEWNCTYTAEAFRDCMISRKDLAYVITDIVGTPES